MAASAASSSGAGAVFALVVVAAGITAAIDRYGTMLPLPLALAAVPLLAGLVLAFRARSLAFGDVIAGTAASEATAGAAGTMLLSALALVAAPVAIGLGGPAGLVLVAVAIAGVAIARFAIGPALGSSGAATPAGALRRRFGPLAGALATLAGMCALLPLLAAEAALAGTILQQMVGLSPTSGLWLVVGAATLAALAGGRRSAAAMAAALLPVLALAYLAPVAVAASAAGDLPLPWTALADGRALGAPTAMPAPVAALLALLLLLGLAVLPSLAAPVSAGARQGSKSYAARTRVAFMAAALVLLAAPAYVLYGRLAGIDPAVNPAGLVLNFAAYVSIGTAPALLLAGGLIAAAAVALAGGLAAFGATLAEDVYAIAAERGAPPGRRVFIARLGIVAAALAALGLSGAGLGTAALATLGLSFAAAGLAPALMVAWNWPAARGAAVSAGILSGLGFVILDTLLATGLPALGGALGMSRIAPTVLGPTGWFGLPIGASGTAGALIGIIVLVAVALVGQRRDAKRASPPPSPAADLSASAELMTVSQLPSDPGVPNP